jgi:carboxyl-terminal processing protease
MLVLVNGNSASASELFAASLRDFCDVKLVGTQTFGKGIMQSTFGLKKGAVTMTVAAYSTTKSECYHKIGLTPDYEVKLPEKYTAEIIPPREDDTQLQKAIELLQTR